MLMMWLVGNSVQVFSIMMVFMLLGNPIRAILNTNKGESFSFFFFFDYQIIELKIKIKIKI